MAKTLEKILSKLEGYLMSISRNVDTGLYELEVGFRKNWAFKSNDDIECDITLESDNGSLVTISGKHDEVIVDDLVDYVSRVIETNKQITEMQEELQKQLEDQKQAMEDKIIEFDKKIEKFKETSLAGTTEEEPSKKKVKSVSEEFIEDDELAQKIS